MKYHKLLFFLFLFSQTKAQIQIEKVYIVSQVCRKDSIKSIPDDKPKYPIKDLENAILGIVVEAKKDGKKVYFSEFDQFEINGKIVDDSLIEKPENLEGIEIRWYKVEPDRGSYSNEKIVNGKRVFQVDKIIYREIEWPCSTNCWKRFADVTPVFLDKNDVGTMRYKVEIKYDGKTFSTQSEDKAHRISVRGNTGNEIIDWAYSFFNLPYIWGSTSKQVENYIGFDCADFVVAAGRKAGFNVPYTWTPDLPRYLEKITQLLEFDSLDEEGYYYDRNKEIAKFDEGGVKPGDVVLWKRHVGILLKDCSNPKGKDKGKPNGILDKYDIVIHTLFHEPKEEEIGKAYIGPIKILRFKK